MNKKTFIGSIIGLALLVAAIIYFNGRDRSYSWKVNLRHNGYEPYDIGLYVDVLEESFGEDYEHILKSKQFEAVADSGVGTMLYLDQGIGLTADHIDLLLGFIERGNTAVFSSDIIPENLIERITDVDFDIEYTGAPSPSDALAQLEFAQQANGRLSIAKDGASLAQNYEVEVEEEEIELTDTIYFDEDDVGYYLYIEDSVVTTEFIIEPNNSYQFHFLQKDSLQVYDWSGFPKDLFDEYNETDKFTALSLIEDSIVDIISMAHGQGKLIFHSNPIFFSNLYFKEEFGYDYAADIVGLFGEGKVYFNQHYTYLAPPSSGGISTDNESESPLRFILKHKGLKWSIFSLMALSIIYLLFSLKRQLPVLEYFKKPKNTSISYVQALSGFYSSAEDDTLLCAELMTAFKHFLRTRYKINTNVDKDELIPIISRNSGINEGTISSIFEQEFKINFSNDSKRKGTVGLYKTLEKFYQNCK